MSSWSQRLAILAQPATEAKRLFWSFLVVSKSTTKPSPTRREKAPAFREERLRCVALAAPGEPGGELQGELPWRAQAYAWVSILWKSQSIKALVSSTSGRPIVDRTGVEGGTTKAW